MNKLQTTSILNLVEKISRRKTMVGFDRARKKIFGHTSNFGSVCLSDGIRVGYTRTAKGVLRFCGSFSTVFQPKELLGHLHCCRPLKRQSRGDDEQLCRHRKSTSFGCVFYDANLTFKVHWNIPQGLNNTPRKWDTDRLLYRIFFHWRRIDISI